MIVARGSATDCIARQGHHHKVKRAGKIPTLGTATRYKAGGSSSGLRARHYEQVDCERNAEAYEPGVLVETVECWNHEAH